MPCRRGKNGCPQWPRPACFALTVTAKPTTGWAGKQVRQTRLKLGVMSLWVLLLIISESCGHPVLLSPRAVYVPDLFSLAAIATWLTAHASARRA